MTQSKVTRATPTPAPTPPSLACHETLDVGSALLFVDFMSSVITPRPILIQDIALWVVKVILLAGTEIVGPAQAILRPLSDAKLAMDVYWREPSGEPIQFGELADGDPMVHVCYQYHHIPTSRTSPIYSHPFKQCDHSWGTPMKIYGMGLYPAEKVWPELCDKGWYGELPQFYT